ncbi:UDP-3-O-[3-hydroxymyristoyl] N-acetylglucosamine deacetylase [Thermosulfidibacter takaii ABI70S6]|uniref:UDP-3-O-acyl-N-acetylglucosamine deacetylase n=1 Tax=Thermosulfidibacter takaii (strain DSM 17441 / JCM 13301 / NBRC 103674 / ABI70S6) TaxID=1298851 RepID=A0A0S3QSJ2_THET7|nr:UDP-3-O-acyl-N-acetylglucosamine deacetylase [Thermosulfidibacter takaii]BAT71311.1 UDP-3-O-[3-hydroxymyristoyl] N-acetylglucosamine deacetylase [Thermosulfidibacter takaii ABI70S6]
MERKTLRNKLEIEGFGIHTGKLTRMKIHPAVNDGGAIVFKKGKIEIKASPYNVTDVRFATVIGKEGEHIRTVEHLMSALYGCGITDAVIEVEGEEIPIMDGSSKEFVELIKKVGIESLGRERRVLKAVKPFRVEENGGYVEIEPINDDCMIVECAISYDHPYLDYQDFSMTFSPEEYEREVAPARTYCFYEQIAHLLKSGLGRGGNYRNVVVIGKDGVLNGPPRFEDEPVRHKVLDLIGDMALSGCFILGKIKAYKSGHALHNKFLREFLSSDCYEILQGTGIAI